ncbi:ATP-grasp domain-containing protein [Pedobacter steynii]
MKPVIKVLKRVSRILRIIVAIKWLKLWSLYDSNSEIIVWVPFKSIKYFGSDAFIWDMATIAGLIEENKRIKIVSNLAIGKYHNKKIFFSISNRYNIYKFDNYTHILSHITMQLEQQGNSVFPKHCETMLWENKTYMHQVFYVEGVNEPKTRIFESIDDLLKANIHFPFLIKAEHSSSSEGLYKISSYEDLADLVSNKKFVAENRHIIAQELINMRKDLRVILVKGEILLHYWRINLNEEWKPTSTSYGSKVDFDYFPEQWRTHIIETFKSLKITTGAFDVTWENDDLSTKPIYLEVSPFYQPNPKMELKKKAYAFYKQHFSLFNSWDVKYVNVVFDIKHKQVKAYLEDSLAN